MGNTTLLVIYGLVFLSGLLLFEGLFQLLAARRGAEGRVNRRLQLLNKTGSTREVLAELRRQRPQGHSLLGPLNDPYFAFATLLEQSGVRATIRQMLMTMAALAMAAFLAASSIPVGANLPTIIHSPIFALAVALLVGVGVPLKYLSYRKAKRLKQFGEQLPEALDIIVRSLRAGHPVSTALGMVARELPDPIGSEFGIAVDEMTYGLDLNEALGNLAGRVPSEELQYVVVSIEVQHETGGNLAEILASLSEVIRARFRMKKKIRALSGEGRVSAIVLCVLPFITGGAILLLNPGFYINVADDPLFWPGMGIAGAMMVGGVLVMRRLVNFRI